MGKARSAAAAALVATLIAAGGSPAYADDPAPLAVTSTGLSEGQVVGPSLLFHPVWSEGANVTKVEVYADGVLSYTALNWTAGLCLRLSGKQDGTEELITIRAYDSTGAWAEASTHVVVDQTPPTATISPVGGSLVQVGGVLTVNATDVSDDLAEMSLYGNNGVTVASVTSAPWTITYDTVGGPQRVYVHVTDRAGNTREYAGYQIDNQPPTIGDPTGFRGRVGRVSGATHLDIPLSGGANHIEVRVDGTLTESWDGGHSPTSYGTTNGADIDYNFGTTPRTATVDVLVRDVAGNTATKSFALIVDPTGPTITSLTPANGALVRGSTIYFTIHATDPDGVAYPEVNGCYCPSGPDRLFVAAGADGSKTLVFRVYDNLFNFTTATRTVIVDNTRPTLTITSAPKNGAHVKGTVKINAAAADRNGVARVELLINGKVVAQDVTAGYSFAVNTTKYGKTFNVQLRAYDRAGNVTTTSTRTWHR
ncbi:Ig-like domain-containing protein [Actinoplanes sp. KI2]|uniref:Ig-like domain-containing protein n=1 Tax=Actinoplanes sp. KI2 TaxID=2983315 RepID=UPI0021D56F63|nr:Ig-like domain-containing protein [Actinoplanes sp. KI2]MCU7725228.1 Ig-like domain-containing protein [Actinoplanes sp. KI2]